jgi:diadenosine tetraphosphate (Ap4A) HIT family hydrolase
MAHRDTTAECFVCRKHREQGSLLPGGPVGEDELTVVSHLAPAAPGRAGGPVYLGHLLVEPRRHAPGLADLTDAEAQAVGRWCARASRALREVAGAEHIYAAVIGDNTPRLHVRLLPRYPGTPREYWWDRLDEWPGARLGTEREITAFVRGLHDYLMTATQA